MATRPLGLRRSSFPIDYRLQVLTAPPDLDAVGDLLGRGDRLCLLSPTLHRELYGELR